jgi:hypothetical protein
LTRGFKASDLMGTNKIHIGTTFEMILSTFQSRGEKYARVTREIERYSQELMVLILFTK